MRDAMKLEFFFDCSSPWAYLAFEKIPALIAGFEVELVWRPVLVGGIFNAVNPSVYFMREHIPAKMAHMKKDIGDWSRLDGVEILFPPSIFPINTVKAMRGCLALEADGLLIAFARAAFQAYWRDDRDIADAAVLADLCRGVGADPASFLRRIEEPAIKEALRANTEEAVRRGAFGVPTFFLDGDDMYFGSDRAPTLRQAMQANAAERRGS